jgi:hypothetical protein
MTHAQWLLLQACYALIVQETKQHFTEAFCFAATEERTRKQSKGGRAKVGSSETELYSIGKEAKMKRTQIRTR